MTMPRKVDIDDSGDNLSGTPHNNAWLQDLQDKIDVGLSNALTFPAVALPSSDPNRLDDYEEGLWTPNLLFGGANVGMTYSERTGMYVKIGGFVWLGFRVVVNAKGSSTGVASIGGLPFPELVGPGPTGIQNFGGFFNYYAAMAASITANPTVYVTGTALNIMFPSAGGSAQLSDVHFIPGTFIGFAAYRVQ